MTKYDTLYIPTREMNFGELLELDGCGLEEKEGPIICLTIEELSDLWNAGYRAARADLKMETKKPALDFEEYLTSKGISI